MLVVHIERPSNRARYVIEHVVKELIGWDLDIIDQLEEFRGISGPKLIYSEKPLEDDLSLHVAASGWLQHTSIKPFEPEVDLQYGVPVFFPIGGTHDLFAGIFYLLSRHEEYFSGDRDEHGRLRSRDHFVVKHGIEKLPVVDLWALHLANDLQRRFPELPKPSRNYSHVVTVDIDNGLKYLGRPLWRQGGAAIRDLMKGSPALAAERIAVLRGTK
ncbi:MAG: hypothetical protein M3R08_07725, partial [Bacteroidota bacterium]|nr:hypothetical protein [Bacteroidota bacterium]